MKSKRSGILDIGSNSIRLVIYEQIGPHAHRVIDESKQSARLSGKVEPDGSIPLDKLDAVIRTLNDFQLLSRLHGVESIRAVATAAIRNAANSRDIVDHLEQRTGLTIEVLSGQEEARIGFLGMINTFDIQDGFVIDIGGGSTEISLFAGRRLRHSVSLPFGAVNMAQRFNDADGCIGEDEAAALRALVEQTLAAETWLRRAADAALPLIGLGGTIRSLCKIDQKRRKYAWDTAHNYEMSAEAMDELVQWLPTLPAEKRKKVDGLSGDRSDIIAAGLLILHTVFNYIGASHYLVSGAGLRDGLFFETEYPDTPIVPDVLDYSVRNLLALHPSVPMPHVEQVHRLATRLFDDMGLHRMFGDRARRYIQTAALLYRIGVTVHYYSYYKHTFYVMAHSRIDGLSHRETLLCALIASYKSRNRSRQLLLPYKELLEGTDLLMIDRLGSLLRLAIALDRSETQPIRELQARYGAKMTLELRWECTHTPLIELRELEQVQKELFKAWGLRLKVTDATAST